MPENIPQINPPTDVAPTTLLVQKKPSRLKTATTLWLSSLGIFLGALIVGIIAWLAPGASIYAGFFVYVIPAITAIAWWPLGITSLIYAIISLIKKEDGKAAAILLIIANSIPTLLFIIYLITVFSIRSSY